METHFQARQTHNPKITKQVYEQFIEKSTREGNLEKNTKTKIIAQEYQYSRLQ